MKNPTPDSPSLQDRIISRLKILGIFSQRLQQPEVTTDIINQKAVVNAKKYEDYLSAIKKRGDAGEFDLQKSPPKQRLIQSPVFLPDSTCVVCLKTLQETGGRRIIAQQLRGILISSKPIGGGDKDYPYISIKLSLYPLYLVVWGPSSMWSEDAVKRATEAFHKGKRSWFCQLCGNRICVDCGSPLQQPVGSDVLYDDGSSFHVGMLPCHPGCVNLECKNHKDGGVR